jgi:uncharacterized small protein (DUF1192 family)
MTRYVDDMLIISKKTCKKRILNVLNKFDPDISFTHENMDNFELAYLDTKIKLINGKFELFNYTKPGKSSLLQNFITSVSPINQKISLLTGEIFRMNNTTSSKKALDESLEQLKEKFVANNYPPALVDNKISEIRENEFTPTIRDDSDIQKHFYLPLDYTSERCYKIGLRIQKLIHKITPKFKVTVAWKTIRLEKLIHKYLKRQKPPELKTGVVYEFTCPCSKSYIGETKRAAQVRWIEHCKPCPSNPAIVGSHIKSCPTFSNHFKKSQSDPNTFRQQLQPKDYALKFFKIIASNLNNYTQRMDSEAILIRLKNPQLNKQTDFKNLLTCT